MDYIKKFCYRVAVVIFVILTISAIINPLYLARSEQIKKQDWIEERILKGKNGEKIWCPPEDAILIGNQDWKSVICSEAVIAREKVKFEWQDVFGYFTFWLVGIFFYTLFCFTVRYIFTGKIKTNK